MAEFINNADEEQNFLNYGEFVESVGGVFQGSEQGSSDKALQPEEEAAEQGSSPRMEATFKEKQALQVFGEVLNARSAKDKPFLLLREAFINILGDVESNAKFIDSVIVELRNAPSFPYLNAVYVANARLFLKEHKVYNTKTIATYVNNMNKRFGAGYLDINDFFRYIQIAQHILFTKKGG